MSSVNIYIGVPFKPNLLGKFLALLLAIRIGCSQSNWNNIFLFIRSLDKMPADLFHPSSADEKNKHKLKRLIQAPNSFFMDVKCPGCFHITTVFSHAQVSR